MNSKQAAIQTWLGGFMTAYPVTAVPEGAELPYLTYEAAFANWGDGETNCSVNIYMETESEAEINAKAKAIGDSLGLGGKCLLCEGGCIWVKRGSPFSQPVTDEPGIKRRLVNISIEHLTI